MDPTIWNEFSTAAFRWHSLIQVRFFSFDPNEAFDNLLLNFTLGTIPV